jgi:hypothetical protein
MNLVVLGAVFRILYFYICTDVSICTNIIVNNWCLLNKPLTQLNAGSFKLGVKLSSNSCSFHNIQGI